MWVRVARLAASSALFGLLCAALAGSPAWSGEPRLAINGYDPVAYFTEAKPVPGQAQFEYVWHDARWRFASAAHRDLFVADPEHYAPQYDGYCALGMTGTPYAAPHKDTVDPEAWAIVDGKLYLTHTRRVMDRWHQKAAEYVKRADENWATVRNQAEPEIVGPPCRDHPPSTVVAVPSGGRVVIIGGQVSVDNDGNIVGKSDMQAQIEQVGKNVQACLAAAGTNTSNIVLTRAYVTDTGAFSKNADLRTRYFGPQSPMSTIVEVPKIPAGPDFLVEIEAVAAAE
jgi:enamine deaminase RidA (YjgF/YER057c/UK114 family)